MKDDAPSPRSPRPPRSARLRRGLLVLALGATAQSLERTLECESAVVRRKSAPPADDTFVLPRRWIDVDVDTEADGFVAFVRADTIDDARRIRARAERYVARGR
jgi:hypothetical protein